MDKNAIKKFAVWARRKLIEDIQQKAFELGISEKEIKEPQVVSSDAMVIGDRTLNKVEMEQRKSLVYKVKEKGFEQIIEEVAYTWFNRLIALRFMEVNGYLPSGVRALSSMEEGKKEPDIIHEALNVNLDVDRELIYQFQDVNDTVGLYRYLLVKQCNALFEILPGLFEPIEDYTEILLPSNLLSDGSVIRELVDSILEDDFKEQVEIIGWMYQYYISEKKDEVFEGLKKNIKITKENIPAATQLFTPDWIVKYMVENSLGRLWLEGHPDQELKGKWKYYLEEAEQESEVQKQLEEIREQCRNLKPEDIKVLDPAMGSGHILVYAFDLLYDIYKSSGYAERDIPKIILKENLFGLDIDDRAYQLAYFAVMMKARKYDRRFLTRGVIPNLCAIRESNCLSSFEYEAGQLSFDNLYKDSADYLIKVFKDAKEYGSILNIEQRDYDGLVKYINELQLEGPYDLLDSIWLNAVSNILPELVKQAKIMAGQYNLVITNPPYMGSSGMGTKLSNFVKNNYFDAKSDISTVFMEKSLKMCKSYGMMAMINIPVWMFISSFKELRYKIETQSTFINMLHFGRGVFGSDFGTTAFVIAKFNIKNYNAVYRRLHKESGNVDSLNQKELWFFSKFGYYTARKESFLDIPTYPIGYWATNHTVNLFKTCVRFGNIAEPRQGLATGNDDYYLRNWYEVEYQKIGFGRRTKEDLWANNKKYAPFNKGGAFRKWYGNNNLVIKFDEFNYNKLLQVGNHLPSRQFYFSEGITWSALTAASFSGRYCDVGFVFAGKGPMCFPKEGVNLFLILGLLNSKITDYFMKFFSSTTDFNQGPMRDIPIVDVDRKYSEIIIKKTQRNIAISKTDWDSFETSWDFEKHLFIKWKTDSGRLEDALENWKCFTDKQFNNLKANEEDLNRILIEIYGLQHELSPQVEEKDVTIRKADIGREIRSFISYAVGCMFGRYSLDVEGLVYASGNWDLSKYSTFTPNQDNILPIFDDEYFDNDIVSRFIEFVKIIFGEETLEQNIDFISNTLGKRPSETSAQTIRRYFLKDFYKDHVKTYQKKPIYWLFDSGKQDGFKALIYMHRYDEFTVARVRTDYLHKLQKSYESEVKRLDVVIDSSASEREKANARKRKEKILKQMEECLQYDQVIAHVANQRIKIDLDDGVIVNYAKFQGVEIPQGEGKKPLKADLLAKI